MAHIAVIIGISGAERYLAWAPFGTDDRSRGRMREVANIKDARHFRSDTAAIMAARDHIAKHEPIVARSMAYRVEERA